MWRGDQRLVSLARATTGFIAASLLLAACAGQGVAPSLGGGATVLQRQQIHAIPVGTPPPTVGACSSGPVTCHGKERADILALPESPALAPSAVPGLHPSDLQSAYALPVGNGSGTTVAIVVAYANPVAESDLAVYRKKFGLTPCTVASHCLRIVAAGNVADAGWAAESAIDLDMVSAACPRCSIALFEAKDDTVTSLLAAERAAVASHPAVISNSWSVQETATLGALVGGFSHPGIAVVAGSGDNAATLSWPAVDRSVIAVGGTTLVRDASTARRWSEQTWKNAGFGCSAFTPRPSWQPPSLCATQRAVADIAAVADPLTGVAVYDTFGGNHAHPGAVGGWEVYGGTSVATPIVAGAIALAGNAPQLSDASFIYQHAAGLNPVYAPLGPLPSGLGTPNGIAAL